MTYIRRFLKLVWHNREAVIWITALLLLAVDDPGAHHYTLCPFHNAGLNICPGCGLGRSITLFFHGEITTSLQTHPLGIAAVFMLTYRAVKLILRPENRTALIKNHNYA